VWPSDRARCVQPVALATHLHGRRRL